MAQAGSGVTYALDGMCVLGAGLHSRQGMNGMVDMSGPAAEMSPYAKLINLVFVAENADPKEDVPFICAMSSGMTSLLLSVPVTGIVSEKGVLAAEKKHIFRKCAHLWPVLDIWSELDLN